MRPIPLFAAEIVWGSDGHTDEFFDAYLEFMAVKTDDEWVETIPDEFTFHWQSPDATVSLSQVGNDVTHLIIGPSFAVARIVEMAFDAA